MSYITNDPSLPYAFFAHIDEAIPYNMTPLDDQHQVMIISYEQWCQDLNKAIRKFTAFRSYSDFANVRSKFNTCHELFVMHHTTDRTCIDGKIVFDFDIDHSKSSIAENMIPADFKAQVEQVVTLTIDQCFLIDCAFALSFVWTTSNSIDKFSKHLTVNGIYLSDWINMSKMFYHYFAINWNKAHNWATADDFVDSQIIKYKGSLRMMGSCKVKDGKLGPKLELDDPNRYTLTDSLMHIYDLKHLKHHTIVEPHMIKEHCYDEYIGFCKSGLKSYAKYLKLASNPSKHMPSYQSQVPQHEIIQYTNQIDYDQVQSAIASVPNQDGVFLDTIIGVIKATIGKVNVLCPNVFAVSKIAVHHQHIRLIFNRLKPYKCLITPTEIHEAMGAYAFITYGKRYYVRFGCFRDKYCKGKTIELVV